MKTNIDTEKFTKIMQIIFPGTLPSFSASVFVHKVVPFRYVCWFINPMNTIDISTTTP